MSIPVAALARASTGQTWPKTVPNWHRGGGRGGSGDGAQRRRAGRRAALPQGDMLGPASVGTVGGATPWSGSPDLCSSAPAASRSRGDDAPAVPTGVRGRRPLCCRSAGGGGALVAGDGRGGPALLVARVYTLAEGGLPSGGDPAPASERGARSLPAALGDHPFHLAGIHIGREIFLVTRGLGGGGGTIPHPTGHDSPVYRPDRPDRPQDSAYGRPEGLARGQPPRVWAPRCGRGARRPTPLFQRAGGGSGRGAGGGG